MFVRGAHEGVWQSQEGLLEAMTALMEPEACVGVSETKGKSCRREDFPDRETSWSKGLRVRTRSTQGCTWRAFSPSIGEDVLSTDSIPTAALRTELFVLSLSRVGFFATPWTVAHQAALTMGFPRQEY